MAAVQFGADINRQAAAGECLAGARRVGRGRGEVAAKGNQHFYFVAQHCFNRRNRVVPGLARRGEIKMPRQAVEQGGGRFFVDPHRAVALHVTVTAHRAQSRTRLA